MKYSFYADLTACVFFSDEDWSIILRRFNQHYDGTIKAAVMHGGWLYGKNNRRVFSNGENKTAELSSYELQLMIKSLEMFRSEEEDKLSSRLWKILKDLMSTREQLNKTFEDKDTDNA